MDPQFVDQMARVGEKITGEYAAFLLQHAKMDQLTTASGSKDIAELVVLDEACGTGAIASRLLHMLDDKTRAVTNLTMLDIAKPSLEYAERRLQREGCNLKALRTLQGDVTDTKLPSSHFTHVFFGFGPMAITDWRAALREIHRMLHPGGLAAMSTWGDGGWLPDVRAALASDPSLPRGPSAKELLEAFSPDSDWSQPTWIETVLREFGFEDVQIKTVPRTSVLDGMDEFMITVPMTLGNVIDKCWSQGQAKAHGERAKETLVRYVAQKYGSGEIRWDWVAHLITARKPVIAD
ncbi:uncharacterized protein PV07_00955 [Cladophialophora immunda]|uniref:Methyltransferase domain-containing protein n=1 Tax=Cladophialophora immunda TaxID=569365 RepID=A0A0D2DEN7_9EURO|nr:uncharacterized protein PV07_00955 [Cladophialophora immunda]KIW34159.1 hypothetical protein PV07_00955 [Cladophialophora immunda]OQV05026.1 Methyltransferase domain-containing protein [Cladophialophora immunda]